MPKSNTITKKLENQIYGTNVYSPNALLVLENGNYYLGKAFGAKNTITNELIFNTAMSGYQEILTDPSYYKQIIAFSYPHIGNVGINPDDFESKKVYAQGLVIREFNTKHSNFRSKESLNNLLVEYNVPGIYGIDTRHIIETIRAKGSMLSYLTTTPDKMLNLKQTLQEAKKSFTQELGLSGQDLVKEVSTKKPYEWLEPKWQLKKRNKTTQFSEKLKIVVLDFGVKHNILRILKNFGCKVMVLPASSDYSTITSYQPDGVILSNGPGDPEPCYYAIATIKKLLQNKIPTFGICLGHQLLALSAGAKTLKMKFGHHGSNHPIQDLQTKKVFISTQNHNFVVDRNSLPNSLIETHISLFDNSNQGIKSKTSPAMSIQGHPEANPGPQDLEYLFEEFIAMIKKKV